MFFLINFEVMVVIRNVMKKSFVLTGVVLSLCLSCLIVSCNPKEPKGDEVGAQEEVIVPPDEPYVPDVSSTPGESDVQIDYASPYEGYEPIVRAGAPEEYVDVEEYNVDLDVVPEMKKGEEYNMEVKVVLPQFESEPTGGMVRTTKVIYAQPAKYVRVTPIAPGFDVNPPQSDIVDFDPSGTELPFTIIPRKKGPQQITAKVELLQNNDGSGDIKSKTSAEVSVLVKVDGFNIILQGLGELWGVVWKAFLDFWGVFVALVFAALLFVVRKYIKKKTGYGAENDQSDQSDQADGSDLSDET